jgi:hypothetical protein
VVTLTEPGAAVTNVSGEPNFNPGGIVPEIVHDCGGFWVGGVADSWKAVATICEPTVPVAGLGVLASSEKTVAPAIESTAPKAANDTATDLMTEATCEPMGKKAAIFVPTPGILWRRARRTAAGIRIRRDPTALRNAAFTEAGCSAESGRMGIFTGISRRYRFQDAQLKFEFRSISRGVTKRRNPTSRDLRSNTVARSEKRGFR